MDMTEYEIKLVQTNWDRKAQDALVNTILSTEAKAQQVLSDKVRLPLSRLLSMDIPPEAVVDGVVDVSGYRFTTVGYHWPDVPFTLKGDSSLRLCHRCSLSGELGLSEPITTANDLTRAITYPSLACTQCCPRKILLTRWESSFPHSPRKAVCRYARVGLDIPWEMPVWHKTAAGLWMLSWATGGLYLVFLMGGEWWTVLGFFLALLGVFIPLTAGYVEPRIVDALAPHAGIGQR